MTETAQPQPTRRRRRRTPGRATGRFATRPELTAHVWAIRRQQLRPNLSAIAEACGASVDVVRTILAHEEGLACYLERGLGLGAAAPGADPAPNSAPLAK